MLFIQTLRRLFGGELPEDLAARREREREALRKAWHLDADDPVMVDENRYHEPTDPAGQGYDEHLWRGKLVNLCSEINAKNDLAGQAKILMGEAHNLAIGPKVIFESAQAAFQSAIRQVVADRHVTDEEHRRLDALRDALGLPDDLAAEILETIAAEASAIFKSQIEGL
ncbi:MAG: hypothetical protein ACKO0V_15280 [bacterium]